MTIHDPDLDGRCESCGEPIGFSGSHSDEDCARSFLDQLRRAVELLKTTAELLSKSPKDEASSELTKAILAYLEKYGNVLPRHG